MSATDPEYLAHQAGVKCPKETGELSLDESCNSCSHFWKCVDSIWGPKRVI